MCYNEFKIGENMKPKLRKPTSNAFYSNIVSRQKLILKILGKHARHLQEGFSEAQLQDAICKMLSEKIRNKINTLPETRQMYVKNIKTLCKQSLDAVEFNEKREKRDAKLKTQFKLHFALDAIDNSTCELDQASLLMAIYLKVADYEKQADGSFKKSNQHLSYQTQDSSIYRYLDSARSEEKYTISLTKLSYLSMQDLVSNLYYSAVICDCKNDPDAISKYAFPEDANYEQEDFKVIDLETDSYSYEELISLINEGFERKFMFTLKSLENNLYHDSQQTNL